MQISNNHLLESNNICAMGTIHAILPLYCFRHLGPCPGVGKRDQNQGHLKILFLYLRFVGFEQHVQG